MHGYLMFALALSPLLLMVFLILKLKMPIHYSVLITLAFTIALSAIFWDMPGSDSNLLIVLYVQIMPDDLVMQLHRF